jgi:hypothetical protein
MLSLLLSLLQSFQVKCDEGVDEFEEVSVQSLPSQSRVDESTGGPKELYQSLSIVEKLHYQLRRSGDISGKYGLTS